MKQKLYILGLITTLIIFLGLIFKINHWPGAGILLTIGISVLVLLFLPLALADNYRSEESNHSLSLYIVTWLTCFVVFVAMLFKFQHWPFAGPMLAIALPFPYVVFLPVFLKVTSKNKNFNIYNTIFVLVLLATNSVFSGLLALNVTRERIHDSYNLAYNYTNISQILAPVTGNQIQTPLSIKIDETLQILDECERAMLVDQGPTLEKWKNGPRDLLLKPDVRGYAFYAIYFNQDNQLGKKLESSLSDLISLLRTTKGYENVAKYAYAILYLTDQDGSDSDIALRISNNSYLPWALIYIDGLRTNLLLIKTLTAI